MAEYRTAAALKVAGRWEDSIEPLRRSVAALRALDKPDGSGNALRTAYFDLVGSLHHCKQYREAVDVAREALALNGGTTPIRSPEEPSPVVRQMFYHLMIATCLKELDTDMEGQAAAGRELVRIADTGSFTAPEAGLVAKMRITGLQYAGAALMRLGRSAEGAQLYERLLTELASSEQQPVATLPPGLEGADEVSHRRMAAAYTALALLRLSLDQVPEGLAAAREALARDSAQGPEALWRAYFRPSPALSEVENHLLRLGRDDEMVRWLDLAVPALRPAAAEHPLAMAGSLNNLAWSLCRLGRAAEAVAPALEAADLVHGASINVSKAFLLAADILDTAATALGLVGDASRAAALAREALAELDHAENAGSAQVARKRASTTVLLDRVEGRAQGSLLDR